MAVSRGDAEEFAAMSGGQRLVRHNLFTFRHLLIVLIDFDNLTRRREVAVQLWGE